MINVPEAAEVKEYKIEGKGEQRYKKVRKIEADNNETAVQAFLGKSIFWFLPVK